MSICFTNKYGQGYQTTSYINEGGFNSIYKASLGSEVYALKVPKSNVDPQTIIYEAEMLGFLNKKDPEENYVLTLVDRVCRTVGSTHTFALVLKYKEQDLIDWIENHRVTPYREGTRSIISQLLRISKFLEEEGVCFHDLKPGNYLVDLKGKVVLADFEGASFFKRVMVRPVFEGIIRERKPIITQTLETISPEWLIGRGSKSNQGDLWALGCVIGSLLGSNFFDIEKKEGDPKETLTNRVIVAHQSRLEMTYSEGFKGTRFEPYLRSLEEIPIGFEIEGIQQWMKRHFLREGQTDPLPQDLSLENHTLLVRSLVVLNPDKRLSASQALEVFEKMEKGEPIPTLPFEIPNENSLSISLPRENSEISWISMIWNLFCNNSYIKES